MAFDEKTKITQANSLIERKDSLSTNEYRLFLTILSLIQKRETNIYFELKNNEECKGDLEKVRELTRNKLCEEEQLQLFIDVKGFIEDWDIKSSAAYSYLIKAVESFRKKGMSVEVTDPMGSTFFTTIPFVKAIKYKKGEAAIEVVVNEYLIPYVSALSKEYTIIFMKEVKKLPSANCIRLYELLKQNQGMVKAKWKMTDFEALMYSTYSSRNSFVQKVVQKNVEIINEKADIQVSYEITGRGDKAQIEFVIKEKKILNEQEHSKYFTIENLMLAAGKVGEDLKQDYVEFIIKSIEGKIAKGEIKKVSEYIKKIIENDSQLDAFNEEQRMLETEFKKQENDLLKAYLRKINEEVEAALVKRREYIYMMEPEIKTLEEERVELGSKISRALLGGKVEHAGKSMSVADIRKYAEEVDEKLAALLDKNGMKPDFLERKYKCSICSDSCVHPDTGGHCSCRADRIKEAKAFYKDKE